jgi:hypothetical protein
MKISRRRENSVAAQEAAEAALTAVEAVAPSKQDEETMAAIMAAQKVAEAAPTMVKAGALTVRDEDTVAAIMAAQKAVGAAQTKAEAGKPLKKTCRLTPGGKGSR